jgi:hypothetical protein
VNDASPIRRKAHKVAVKTFAVIAALKDFGGLSAARQPTISSSSNPLVSWIDLRTK